MKPKVSRPRIFDEEQLSSIDENDIIPGTLWSRGPDIRGFLVKFYRGGKNFFTMVEIEIGSMFFHANNNGLHTSVFEAIKGWRPWTGKIILDNCYEEERQ